MSLADPGEALLVLGGDVVGGLVLPVRGDAFFGDAVHVLGADLDLELMAAFSDERGVQGLIQVGPGHGDEVLEAAGDGTPGAVQQAEDGVAVLLGLRDDADGEEIVDLIDGNAVRVELLLDGVEALDARFDAGVDVGVAELRFKRADDAIEECFAFAAEGIDFSGELVVGEGVDVAEGEVFKLAAQLAHAEAVRERGVDVEGLAGDALLLVGAKVLERAHVVQAVGELDDDDADVGDHGEEHLADVFGLMVFAVGELDFVELGDAFDDVRDLLAELAGDLLRGDVGVFDGVVQQAGGDGGGVHLQVGEDLSDFERMDDVGLAGGAALAVMLLQAEGPGGADEIEVVGGAVGADGVEHVLEARVEVVFRRRVGREGCGGRGCFKLGGDVVTGGRRGKGARGFVEGV